MLSAGLNLQCSSQYILMPTGCLWSQTKLAQTRAEATGRIGSELAMCQGIAFEHVSAPLFCRSRCSPPCPTSEHSDHGWLLCTVFLKGRAYGHDPKFVELSKLNLMLSKVTPESCDVSASSQEKTENNIKKQLYPKGYAWTAVLQAWG